MHTLPNEDVSDDVELAGESAGDGGWTAGELRLGTNLTLRYIEAGTGPLVLLLHGFPDFSYGWRFQIGALAAAGFRVVAPDLRGYNQSSKPRRVSAYALPALALDVVSMIEALGGGRAAALVGHDWGGVIAWYVAERHPAMVERLAILNAPHPAAFARELRTPGQIARSSYAYFFQLPWLPELFLRSDGSNAPLLRAMQRMVRRPDALTERDLEAHRAALAQPGALTAALNYYRAVGRRVLWRGVRRALAPSARDGKRPNPEPGHVHVPTLLLWGERDPTLGVRLTEGLDQWVPDIEVHRFPDAGHWVQLDEPEAVNDLIVRWLRRK